MPDLRLKPAGWVDQVLPNGSTLRTHGFYVVNDDGEAMTMNTTSGPRKLVITAQPNIVKEDKIMRATMPPQDNISRLLRGR